MTSKIAQEAQRQETLARLRSAIPVGATVYTIIRSVSASGMSRAIAFYYVDGDDLHWIDMGSALGLKMHRSEHGWTVKGAGMDMAYGEVYALAKVLHGDGYALRQRAL